jgi:NADP-dependent 3-hydroxy-3-methylglutaryl-CoA reductase
MSLPAGRVGVEDAAAGCERPRELRPVSLPRIPKRGVYSEEARLERLHFVREQTGGRLASLQHTSLAAGRLTGNVENLIGSVEVPVGVAGPLLFRGEAAEGLVYAPLATTEGALVASATRGAIAVSRSGGVVTRVIRQQMTRVPLFVFADARGALRFSRFVLEHEAELRAKAESVSRHARLTSVEATAAGRMVNVVFRYETGDAAGQNMTTSCTWHACQWLIGEIEELPGLALETFLVEGAMSGDKKVTFQSFLSGRGTRVAADCFLSASVLSHVLHVTPDQALEAHERGMAGAAGIGMIGYNVNAANVVAALFTATGQDIACVHESSLAQLHVERADGGLVASMLLPSLIVGTVGGGTHLPRQNDCLELMDCAGSGRAARLAEVIAGYCLATDLSTMCAIAGGQFAAAHERLGRNRVVRWFAREDLTPSFFETGLRRVLEDGSATVLAAEPLAAAETGSSILTELTARRTRRLLGLFPYRLTYRAGRGAAPSSVDVMVKVKPLDREVTLGGGAAAALSGARLREAYDRFKDQLGFAGCHLREHHVYGQDDPRFVRNVPRLYDAFADDSREAYVLVLERLADVALMDSADDVSGWGRAEVSAALRGIAEVHAVWYRREKELERAPWLASPPSAARMTAMAELWEELGRHAFEEFPEWVSAGDLALHHGLVRSTASWWSEIEAMPRTLIHNDFNPRNIGLRGRNGSSRLCAYDWELATLHLPQRDLAELLCFVLGPAASREEVDHYVEVHRRALEEASGSAIDAKEWRDGYALCLRDLALSRIPLYLMAHALRHFAFMERIVGTLRRLIALEGRR